MRRALIAAGCAVALGCAGEAGPSDEVARVRGGASVGGQVVSTVDGHPITVADVQRAVDLAGVPPEVALRRLQDELVLARAARRAGFEDHRSVERAVRREEVQILLAREIEARHGPEEVDAEALEEAFEANLERFEQPERRGSVHVLASLDGQGSPDAEQAARAWIAGIREELAAAEDPREAAFAIQRRPPEARPFEVVVQEVDPLSRRAESDPDYLTALFALNAEGDVSPPVRTALGWHAIVLTRVEPAFEMTREEAVAVLRDERVAAARGEALEALVAELAERIEVIVEPRNVHAYLARPDLVAEAP